MRLARTLLATATLAAALAFVSSPAGAVTVEQENVTGGHMDLHWLPGFGVDRTLVPQTLQPADPAYANPSGDHTVGVLVNAVPDSGGLALACVDPLGQADYVWEADINMGDGSTRRGLVLRADPNNQFQNSYSFVIFAGLAQIALRKLSGQAPPVVLGSWFTFQMPSGVPAVNSWHHMKVVADANLFRCFWDGVELNDPNLPIIDAASPYLTGFVGTYNFNFQLGGVPVLFDNLALSTDNPVPTRSSSWGAMKALYR